MRGKPCHGLHSSDRRGITPADAGKTPYITYEVATDRDHPRGCGENPCGLDRTNIAHDHPRGCGENLPQLAEAGVQLRSPPRMRGKLDSDEPAAGLTTITPADAGKTLKRSFRNQPFCS